MLKRIFGYGSLISLLLCVVAGTGNASQICATGVCTETLSFADTLPFTPGLALDFSTFDLSLGTLTSIKFIIDTGVSVTGDVDPQGGYAWFDLYAWGNLALSGPRGSIVGFDAPIHDWPDMEITEPTPIDAQLFYDVGTATYNGTTGGKISFTQPGVPGIVPPDYPSANLANSIIVSDYTTASGSTVSMTLTGGFGNSIQVWEADFSPLLTLNGIVPPGDPGHQPPIAPSTVTLQFEYTEGHEVPEPFTLGLCGAGLLAVGLLGRKKLTRS
jgi:hypothetical protein